MLYVARELCLPSGKWLHALVVEVVDGRVVSIYPFESECRSMSFVEEIHIVAKDSDNCSGMEIDCRYSCTADGGVFHALHLVGDEMVRL